MCYLLEELVLDVMRHVFFRFLFQPFLKFQEVFASQFKKLHEIGIFVTFVSSQCKSLSAKKLYCFNYFDEAFSVFLHVRFDFLAF